VLLNSNNIYDLEKIIISIFRCREEEPLQAGCANVKPGIVEEISSWVQKPCNYNYECDGSTTTTTTTTTTIAAKEAPETAADPSPSQNANAIVVLNSQTPYLEVRIMNLLLINICRFYASAPTIIVVMQQMKQIHQLR
jgi:hypothetical protein